MSARKLALIKKALRPFVHHADGCARRKCDHASFFCPCCDCGLLTAWKSIDEATKKKKS